MTTKQVERPAPPAQRKPGPSAPGRRAEPDRLPERWTPLLPRSPRVAAAVLGVVLLVGLLLRCQGLSARSLWFDEAFTWRLVSFSWAEMCERLPRDNSPPLYFLLLKAWVTLFGDTPVALRSLSVLLGAATVFGTWLFTREAFGKSARAREVGLLAAALVALGVFQVRYGWEARPYALGTALAVFSSWALFRALHAGRAVGPWLLYGLLALLFAWTHYYALFSVAAQGLFALGYLLHAAGWDLRRLVRSPAFRCALLAGTIVVVGWLPWLPVFLRQRAQVQADFWTPPAAAEEVAKACYQMMAEPEGGLPSPRQSNWIALDLCVLGLLALWRKARAGEWFVLCAAVLPFALSFLVSAWDTKVFSLRYLLFAHLFLLVGAAALIGRIPSRLDRGAAAVFVLAVLMVVYADFWDKLDVARRPGFRGAAAFLESRRGPGEPVVVCSPLVYLPVRYHSGRGPNWYLYEDGREVPHYHGRAVLTPEDFLGADGLNASGARRVWVVNLQGLFWGNLAVRMPPGWVPVSTTKFTEVLGQGEVSVVEYAASK